MRSSIQVAKQVAFENALALMEFLGFTHAEIAQNASLIDQKIFHSGQNTRALWRPSYPTFSR